MSSDITAVFRRLGNRKVAALGFVAANGAIAALATCLGSMASTILLRPLPYPNPEEIVQLRAPSGLARTIDATEREQISHIASTSLLLRDRAEVWFDTVFDVDSPAVLEWKLRPAYVSAGFFAIFGQPAQGRALNEADLQAGDARAVVLGYSVWQAAFSSRADVVGSVVDIPGSRDDRLGRRWRIVGIMPKGFEFPSGVNFWIPYDDRFYAEIPGLPGYARLAPSVTVEQLASQLPRIEVRRLGDVLRPSNAVSFGYLSAGCFLLLFLSWVQVFSLAVFRFASRSSELSIRSALGAGRWRAACPLLLEVSLIGLASLTTGAVLAYPLMRVTTLLLPLEVVSGNDLWDVTSVAAVALAAATVFGVFALGALVFGSRQLRLGGLPSRSDGRVAKWPLVVQSSVTVAILYVVGLAGISAVRVAQIDLGFEPDRLYAVRLPAFSVALRNDLAERRDQVASQRALYFEALDRLRRVPGVDAVALSTRWPLQYPAASPQLVRCSGTDHVFEARTQYVFGDYLRAVGGRLIEGRTATLEDAPGTVAIVNERMADRLRQCGAAALGSQIDITPRIHFTVVGVVADVVSDRPLDPVLPELYWNEPGQFALIRLKPHAEDAGGLTSVHQTLTSVWGAAAPKRTISVMAEVPRSLRDYSARRSVVALLGATSLLAFGIGLWGLITESVRARSRELGVRRALGADVRHVRQFLWAAIARPLASGLCVGLFVGWLFGALTQDWWYGVSYVELRAGLPAALIVGFGVLAVLHLRARSLDPVSPATALRGD